MSLDRTQSGRESGPCPPLAVLFQYADRDALPGPAAVGDLEQHIDGCAKCQQQLELLAHRSAARALDSMLRRRRAAGSKKFAGAPGRAGKWLVSAAAAVVLLAVACGAAYYVSRSQRLEALEKDLRELGLDAPYQTEGFVVAGPDTLVLKATINTNVIEQVIFRAGPAKEQEIVYRAERPQEGMKAVEVRKTFARNGAGAGTAFEVEVEFVPFGDLPHPFDKQRFERRRILISPANGIVLDPPDDAAIVQFTNLPEQVRVGASQRYFLRGMSLRDGRLYVLLRPLQESGSRWYLQNDYKGIDLRKGDWFMVPCVFDETATQFEVVAVVVPKGQEAYYEGKMVLDSPPPCKEMFGPARITVVRGDQQ